MIFALMQHGDDAELTFDNRWLRLLQPSFRLIA